MVSLDFKRICNALPQGITVQDENGKIIYANAMAVKMIGFSSEKELWRTPGIDVLKKFIIMDEEGKVLSIDQLPGRKMLVGKRSRAKVLRFRPVSGKKEYWTSINPVPLKDENNRVIGIVNTFYDITESKLKEASLKFLNEMSKGLASSLIYDTRLKRLSELIISRVSDGCFIDLFDNEGNLYRAIVAHKDAKKQELLDKLQTTYFSDQHIFTKIADIIQNAEPETNPSFFSPLINTNLLVPRDQVLAKKLHVQSTVVVPLIARGKALGAVTFLYCDSLGPQSFIDKKTLEEFLNRGAFFVDNARLFNVARRMIDQQRQVQASLEQSERILESSQKKFKAIFDTSLDAIIITDDEMRILDINTAALELLLLKKKKALGTKMTRFTSEESERKMAKAWEKFQKIGHQLGEMEVTLSDGHIKTLEYSAKKDLQPHQNLLVLRDISKRIEEEKRREHLLSIASHELRTPLASIRVFIEILKRSLTKLNDEKIDHYLEKIDDKTEVLSRLISDLLDLTRISENKLDLFYELADFNDFLDEVLKDTQLTIQTHHIYKEGKLKSDVVFDKNRMAQVITNLVRNAVKYSPSANKVVIKLTQKKDAMNLAIQDFGIGIPLSDHKKIFDIFYRGKNKSQKRIDGLGVGLFISAQIIKRHGGKISLKSQVGKGSTFVISLPLRPKAVPQMRKGNGTE